VKGGFALELKQLMSRVLIAHRGTRYRALIVIKCGVS
jgi:hypothetical protein